MLDSIVSRLLQPQLPADDQLLALKQLSSYIAGYDERKREALSRTDIRLLDYLVSALAQAGTADSATRSRHAEQLLVLLNSFCLANSSARAEALRGGAAALALQFAGAGVNQQKLAEQRRLRQAALRALRTLVGAHHLIVTAGPPAEQLPPFWEPALAALPEAGAECLTQVSSLNFLLSLLPQPGPHEHLLSLLAMAATDKAAAFHLYAHGALDSLAPLLLSAASSSPLQFEGYRRQCGDRLLACCLRLLAMLCWRVPDAAGRLLEEGEAGDGSGRLLGRVIEALQPGFSTGVRCLAGICVVLAASHRVAAAAAAVLSPRLADALLHRVLPDAVWRVQSRTEATPLVWRCLSVDTLAIMLQSGHVPLYKIAHCDSLLLDGLFDRLLAEPACRPLLSRLFRLVALLSPVWPRQPGAPLRCQLLEVTSALLASTGQPEQPPPPESLRCAVQLLLHALSRRTDSLLQLFAEPGLADFAVDSLERVAAAAAENNGSESAATSETVIALVGNLLLPHSPCRRRLLTVACLSLLLNLLAAECRRAKPSLRLSLAWALANAAYDCDDEASWQLLADRLPALLLPMLDEIQQRRHPLSASDGAACRKLLESLRNLLAGGVVGERRAARLLADPALLPLLESALDPCLPDDFGLRPAALAALVNAADRGAAGRLALLPKEALLLRVRDCLSQPELPLPQLSLRIFSNLMEPTPHASAQSALVESAAVDAQCRSVLSKLGFPDQVAKLLDRNCRLQILTEQECERAERALRLF